MLSRQVFVAVFAAFAIVTVPQTLQSEPGVDALALQEKWRAAMLAANVDALEAMYSDGLVYVHSDGRIQDKQQFLGPFKAGTLRFAVLAGCDVPRVRAYDASAIVSACYELRAGSGPSSRHLFLTAYVNEAGQWRIVAQQTTRLPEKP